MVIGPLHSCFIPNFSNLNWKYALNVTLKLDYKPYIVIWNLMHIYYIWIYWSYVPTHCSCDTAHCSLDMLTAHCSCDIAHCSLPIARVILLIAHWILPISHCSCDIFHCPLLMWFYSLLTAHCSPLITHEIASLSICMWSWQSLLCLFFPLSNNEWVEGHGQEKVMYNHDRIFDKTRILFNHITLYIVPNSNAWPLDYPMLSCTSVICPHVFQSLASQQYSPFYWIVFH